MKDALPFVGGDAALGQGLAQQVGNVTECALLGFIQKLGKEHYNIIVMSAFVHAHENVAFLVHMS